ncbi:MAG: ABC transporter permease subunit/CPBP intramembrane protease [Planctomycetota bacterium]
MRSGLVKLICKKELLDTLRDRRTLFVALVLPLLLYPALLLGLTQVISATQSNLSEQRQRIYVEGDEQVVELLRDHALEPVTEAPDGLRDGIEQLRAEPTDERRAELKRALVEAKLAAVLLLDDGFTGALDAGRQAGALLVDDPTNEESRTARGKVQGALREFADQKREALRTKYPDEAERLVFAERPVELAREEVASKSQKGAYSFAPMLGLLIVIMALTGAFYPAVDLAAGEKERGTMETLLVAPVTRSEIVLGKFVTIWVIAMVTALLNLAVMGLTFSKLAGMAGAGRIEFAMPPSAILAVMVILVPTSALFSAVALALSSFATSYKEGQHYLSPLFLVASPLALVGLLPNIEIGYGLALVPVANVVLLVKAMLLGGETSGPALLATAATFVYAGIALKVAIELFKRESVLFRTGSGTSYDATLLDSTRRGLPQEKHAFLLFFVGLALMFFLSRGVKGSVDVVLAFVLAQAAILVPTLLFIKRFRLDPAATLRLRPFDWAQLPAVVGAAVCTLILVLGMTNLLPQPDKPSSIEEIAQYLTELPLPLIFFLIAVLPPICEELMCRGFLLSAFLPRRGERGAILLSAALFSLLHLEFVRLPGTFLAGVMLGYIGVRTRSVLAPIVFHMVYNGTIFSADLAPEIAAGLTNPSPLAILLAGLGLAVSVWHFQRSARVR